MTAVIILLAVLLLGFLLASDRLVKRFLPDEIDGYPVPMIIFAAIALLGILAAGSLT